ncbi:Glycosyl transferase, group 1 [[Actinomadura] parvosata subsp. kistnae]|uniref:Glycosyl transferase n=1 Tax=[Actinomadura] parvosata subsp. kistnae TaxID=1909395 RepID=A0A1U9ZT86_9ACTN|nr:glycosyltransferase [Nonomuraea sp. ATCC 55076]AQZ61139.1 glycosyl transferase [Nonomuraea sp. ATCC 55076]SPL87478.1 Glycosyl transferase, group 1 [Actinomadura parvosata subsp. kistnae]
MKVDLISEHADPLAAVGGVDSGGQNVHVAALAMALAERGHSVVVHTRRSSESQPDSVSLAPGVTVEYVPAGPAAPVPKDELPPFMPEFTEWLAARWSADPPDVAHAHFWMSGQAALRAAASLGVPVVQTFHALGTVKRRWQGAADTSPAHRIETEREIGLRADMVLATCSDEVNELCAMGIPEHRIGVVPCGVDLSRFCPEGPVAPRTDGPLVLSIGRMVPRKGVDTVIAALRQLPDVNLVIAGGTPDDEEAVRLRELAEGYGIGDRVHVIGSVPRRHVPALMRSADVVVTVPWYEPFGMVPVEAMACGVPVVASAVGGHLDSVAGCGVLVPPRRPRALARALKDVLGDDERRAALGAAGAARARERYGWPRVAELTEAVYTQVIDGKVCRLAALGG